MGKKSLPSLAMHDAPEDFEQLYEANRPLIYRFMFRRTKDEILAQDLPVVYLKRFGEPVKVSAADAVTSPKPPRLV